MREAIRAHLDSPQVARVVYGSIIGLALVAALESHPPGAWVMIGSQLGTALAVALAELYAELIGGETREHRRLTRAEVRVIAVDCAAVAFGVGFPAVFFLLDALNVIDEATAFDVAKWTGVALIAGYGFAASRLAGRGPVASAVRACELALIGVFLIALKALLH